MTESPPRVRAVARVAESARRGRGPVIVPRRRPGHLGPLHVAQLLLIEIVVLAAAAAVGLVAVAGLALILVALARRRGRWWLENRLMGWQYRRRQRIGPTGYENDARLAAVRSLAPGLTIRQVALSDGSPLGVARDDAGWYAVAALRPTAAMRNDPAAGLPVDRMVRVLADSGAPGAILQIVTHTAPAPDARSEQASLAGRSYQALLSGAGPASIPRDRVTWVVVRLDARTMAENSPAAGPDTQPPAVIRTLMRRLLKLLRTGRPCRPLGADELLDALTRSCDLAPARPGGPPPRPQETWTSWRSGRLAHASFWVHDWPSVARAGALLEALSTAPAALSSVALILAPDGDAIDLRCLVRVAATEDQLGTAVAEFQRCAEQFQSHLFRLDGEHGPAAYASAPTGGGAR